MIKSGKTDHNRHLLRNTYKWPIGTWKCSALPIINASQLDHNLQIWDQWFCNSMRYQSTFIRMDIIKRQPMKCWQGCGKRDSSIHSGWEYKLVQPWWKLEITQIPQKLKIKEIPYDPEVSLLNYLSKLN